MSKKVILDSLQKDSEAAARDISGVAAVWLSSETLLAAANWDSDSLGISSQTDTATGQCDVNFTNAFASTGFTSAGVAASNSANDNITTHWPAITTSTDEVYVFDSAYVDSAFQYTAHGDLA